MERNRVPGIWADCEGGDRENQMTPYQDPVDWYSAGVHCAQCAVHIPDPFYSKLNKIPSTEKFRMEKREKGNSAVTRLACCVQIKPELNEMIVVVAENVSVNGDWTGSSDRHDDF